MEYVHAKDAIAFAKAILQKHGVSEYHAVTVAECLVAADLRGVDTHGINRIPPYMIKVRKGAIDPKTEPVLHQVTPVVAQVDGRNAFGFIGAKMGMARAIEMAATFGIGQSLVSLTRPLKVC